MGARITSFKTFKEKFKKRANGEYEYISGYKGMSKKILIKHLLCGNEFEVIASAFINTKTTCKKCSDKKNAEKTIKETFKKNKFYIKEITNGEYELLEYNGYKNDYSIFKHNKCGHIFKSKYAFFKDRGYRCPKCSRKNSRYTIKELKDQYPIKNLDVLEINYPGPKIKVKCLICNTERNIGMTTYKNYKFNCCKKNKKKKIKAEKAEKMKQEKMKQKEYKKKKQGYLQQLKNETKFYKNYCVFKKNHRDNITILEIVYDTYTKFKVKCNKCNHVWNANFHKLKQRRGCPICKSSRGERLIYNYLIDNEFIFEREYRFINSEISSLRFDFAVFINNEIYLIEFDGAQHFSSDKQFGDNDKKNKFRKIKTNDERKNKYCKDNNIKLLRIPYYKINNVSKILDKFLAE